MTQIEKELDTKPEIPKAKRGFALLDPEKRRALSSKGGTVAQARGTAHRFTKEEAAEAGRKGGRAAHAKRS